MEGKYKAVISSPTIYREVELAPNMCEARVGTGVECDVRLHKSLFFGGIELLFVKNAEGWSVLCSDNLYLTVGDSRKLMTKPLEHGDVLSVKYQDSENDVFKVEFLIDFDSGNRRYERAVEVSQAPSISIGSAGGNHLVLKSAFVKNDSILLLRQGQTSFLLTVQSARYGVYHNGKRVEREVELKNGDFFSLSDYSFYYGDGTLWTEIRNDLSIHGLRFTDHPEPPGYPRFQRNTRLRTMVCEEKIEILDPPPKPAKPKSNLLVRLLPSMGMLLTAGVMAFMGGAMIVMSVISCLMAVFTTVLGIRESNRDYQKSSEERIETYTAYIAKKQEEIQRLRMQEEEELESLYLSQRAEEKRLFAFSPELFDRSPDDEDYLCVRLGSGDVKSKRMVDYQKRETLEVEDELQDWPERVCQEFEKLRGAPVVCDFKKLNAAGVVGAPEQRLELMKNMVIDLAARHYFSDVRMIFVAEPCHRDSVWWLRWLPHVYNEGLGVRSIACNDESKNLIFEYLYTELNLREQKKAWKEHLVVFFWDEYGFGNHPASKFVEKARSLGVTFVFLGDSSQNIPMGCDALISIQDGHHARLIDTHDRGESHSFAYPVLSNGRAEKIVEWLAPVFTEEISLESTLTKNITLFELLDIISADDLDLEARWAESQVVKSMSVPVGMSKTGVVSLDLHDKAHGPHGLVAGTTGSGKSEMLQTYILSVCTRFHPYEVAFVIIDFKGGGMANQFRDLPHLLGMITNIDGRAINRSLKSIKAELQKRQRLFAQADVNHIDTYIRRYKAGAASVPLPHLVIIVDEFAELKAEQPDFMKELISAARIGRSLGVHLILATQKPSGQVNEQIWSNSRFKVCLKVQSQEDSNEMLHAPLAAEIKEPGRAYLQVGNNEIFELFQSAYSGAPERMENTHGKDFTIYNLNESGKRIPVYAQKTKGGRSGSTQLEAVVKHIGRYCNETGLRKLPDICLPPLPETIVFPAQDCSAAGGDGGYPVGIGLYDDPEHQHQGIYSVNLAENHVLLIGSAQSGKTNVLQTIVRSLSTRYTPEEVNLYLVDFASMVLKSFEKLNHVGGVVCSADDEKLKNLFKLLASEIVERKEKMIALGVSSFAAYREAGKKELPLIVLIIDNLTALKELYLQEEDDLLYLCREGLAVGISVVIANAQTAGIGYKYLSNFSCRIALACNDPAEYSALFDHCREQVEAVPGRSLVEIDKTHLDCQMYLAFPGEKEIDRANEIKRYIAQTNARIPERHAKRIPAIPELLTADAMWSVCGGTMREQTAVAVGLDYATVSPVMLNLRSLGVLAISGREGAGRHNFLKYLVHMAEYAHPGRTEVHIVDDIDRGLAVLRDCANVKSYEFLPEKACGLVKSMEAILQSRYDKLANGELEDLNGKRVILLVLNGYGAAEAVCNDPEALAAYKNVTGKYKNANVCVLLGGYENAAVSYSAPEIIRKAKDNRRFLFFDDLANMKILDIPYPSIRAYTKHIDKGDCYYIRDSECWKLKTALDFGDTAT